MSTITYIATVYECNKHGIFKHKSPDHKCKNLSCIIKPLCTIIFDSTTDEYSVCHVQPDQTCRMIQPSEYLPEFDALLTSCKEPRSRLCYRRAFEGMADQNLMSAYDMLSSNAHCVGPTYTEELRKEVVKRDIIKPLKYV